MRIKHVVVAICGVVVLWASQAQLAADEAPPIRQLPHDMGQLATVWIAIPQAVYQVTQDAGPVAGVTRGTVEGSSQMVEDTVNQLTNDYRHDRTSDRRRPMGALFIYSF